MQFVKDKLNEHFVKGNDVISSEVITLLYSFVKSESLNEEISKISQEILKSKIPTILKEGINILQLSMLSSYLDFHKNLFKNEENDQFAKQIVKYFKENNTQEFAGFKDFLLKRKFLELEYNDLKCINKFTKMLSDFKIDDPTLKKIGFNNLEDIQKYNINVVDQFIKTKNKIKNGQEPNIIKKETEEDETLQRDGIKNPTRNMMILQQIEEGKKIEEETAVKQTKMGMMIEEPNDIIIPEGIGKRLAIQEDQYLT
jgi:hypothetical protein